MPHFYSNALLHRPTIYEILTGAKAISHELLVPECSHKFYITCYGLHAMPMPKCLDALLLIATCRYFDQPMRTLPMPSAFLYGRLEIIFPGRRLVLIYYCLKAILYKAIRPRQEMTFSL